MGAWLSDFSGKPGEVMRRLFALLTSVALVLSIAPAQADVVPNRFIITGSGFGHGVGMSQIGAEGLALEGKSATDILNYYFPGTQVTTAPITQDIRVNIAHLSTYQAITGNGLQLFKGDLTQIPVPIPQGATLKFAVVGKVISPTITVKGMPTQILSPNSLFTIKWDGFIKVAGTSLKYGFVSLRAVAGKMEVTTTLKLDTEYIYGVSEMSSAWPTAAISAQAIASRTYGLARVGTIRKECDCNVYNTIYDQNFVGYTKESELRIGSLWKAAVDTTAGMSVTYNGAPINVYFFSSSGGITQRSEDVWGTAFPYLTNVADPYSLDIVLNPSYSHWQRVLNQSDLKAAFTLPDIATLNVDGRTTTNSVTSVTATSSTGVKSTLAVGVFKSKLKIPASWFQIN
jgi:SpoIID/LytB domain protein